MTYVLPGTTRKGVVKARPVVHSAAGGQSSSAGKPLSTGEKHTPVSAHIQKIEGGP